jgi:hypothetical protein
MGRPRLRDAGASKEEGSRELVASVKVVYEADRVVLA